MITNFFPPELRTAAFVTRWNIVWALNKDTVAQHSYFVALYAYMIARAIEWKGPRDYLLWLALTHDLEEIITADIVSPARKVIVDEDKAHEFIEKQLELRLPAIMDAWYDIEAPIEGKLDIDAKRILICADKLEPLIFLMVECRMGNEIGDKLLGHAWASLEAAWRALPAPKDTLDELWQTMVVPGVKEHSSIGGRGLI